MNIITGYQSTEMGVLQREPLARAAKSWVIPGDFRDETCGRWGLGRGGGHSEL